MNGLNYRAKFISQSVKINAYVLDCDDCGHSGFVSPRIGYMPICPNCGKATEISIAEVVRNSKGVNRVGEKEFCLPLENGSLRMVLIQGMVNKTTDDIVSGDFSPAEYVCRVFTVAEKMDAPELPTRETFVVDTPKKKAKSASSVDEDVEYVLEAIKGKYAEGEKFKSKDVSALVIERMTARQTPSRLKKLHDLGILKCDDSSPKNYWY